MFFILNLSLLVSLCFGLHSLQIFFQWHKYPSLVLYSLLWLQCSPCISWYPWPLWLCFTLRLNRHFKESWNRDKFFSHYWNKALELSSSNVLFLDSRPLLWRTLFAIYLMIPTKKSFLDLHYQNLVIFSEGKLVKVWGTP